MGRLDEPNPSLWVETSPAGTFAPLEGDVDVDVVVVGAGITGLLTALLAQRDGADVAVIDAGPLAAGATGYTTAKVSTLQGLVYDELRRRYDPATAAVYAAANRGGLDLVASVVADEGIDCDFSRRSAYTYTEDPSAVASIEAEAEAAREAGLAAELTTETDLPWPVRAAVRVDDQAQFHPRRFGLGVAERIVAGGGRVHTDTRALGLEERRDRATVVTGRGRISARRAVIASHLPFLDRGLYFTRTTAERSYLLDVDPGRPVPRGMYFGVGEGGRSLRSAEADSRLIVGGEPHTVGQDVDTAVRYRALEGWVLERFPGAKLGARWSTQDYRTLDGLPYVGRLHPGPTAALVATGYRKWGMSNGAAAALMLSDDLAGRSNPWAAVFDATRVNPVRSARTFAGATLDTSVRYVQDRLQAVTTRTVDDLGPGEGAVVRQGPRLVAGYRDDTGVLHAVSPRCTHLGCWVTWNTAERSWDCPCHASRFDPDGAVIEGPAVRDLPRR